MRTDIFNATTIAEIEAIFAGFAQERPDAILIAPDAFFTSHRDQLASLAARDSIPAAYSNRVAVLAGGLMSYGPDIVDTFLQVGVYRAKFSAAPRWRICRSCNPPNSSSPSI